MKAIVALLLVAFVPFSQSAQEKPHVVPDTTRFLNTFKKARIELRARSVYMHSLNQGVLTDAQAWAAGIGVGIVTKNYRGFEAGLSHNLCHRQRSERDEYPRRRSKHRLS